MNRELELVQALAPKLREPRNEEVTRQRQRLMSTIRSEGTDAVAPGRRRRRRPSALIRLLAATAALAVVGGGTAFAVSAFQPDGAQVASVERHWAVGRGVLQPGTRPALNAERVVCDYRNVAAETPLGSTFASGFPLGSELTERRLMDECRTGTDAVRTAPVSVPSLLCSVTPPGEHLPIPVVTFGFATCEAAALQPVNANLIDEQNRMRQAEIAILAVPSTCPTAPQTIDWVHAHVVGSPQPLRVLDVDQYPGGRCYLPFVHWGAGTVEIIASSSVPAPGTSATTTPPPAG